MATALTGKITFKMAWDYVNSLDLSDVTDDYDTDSSWSYTVANGTGLDQADWIWHDKRTAAGAVDDIDLNASLSDAFGVSFDLVKVKGIFIRNTDETVGYDLAIGAAAAFPLGGWVSDAATDKLVIGAGGWFVLWNPSAAGYACGAAASDVLRVDPGANTIIYDIIIVGTSA